MRKFQKTVIFQNIWKLLGISIRLNWFYQPKCWHQKSHHLETQPHVCTTEYFRLILSLVDFYYFWSIGCFGFWFLNDEFSIMNYLFYHLNIQYHGIFHWRIIWTRSPSRVFSKYSKHPFLEPYAPWITLKQEILNTCGSENHEALSITFRDVFQKVSFRTILGQ